MQKQNNQNSEQGLVVSYFGKMVAIEDQTRNIVHCHLRRNQELPLVGDSVEWQRDQDNTGTILRILDRKSVLARGDGRGKMKPVAANVDAIFVVMAPPPIFSHYLVNRYLAAAELLDIKPVIVLNKIDLLDKTAREPAFHELDAYRNIPYKVIFSSVYSKDGLDDIAAELSDKTAVLVGPSGVGKSSIIAALGNTTPIKIGAVSEKGAGKHTTTASRLYHVPSGGHLIDSPGVREFNLWHVNKKELLKCFPEFSTHVNCKFRDCIHVAEPGCAVKAAVESGVIDASRYESYQLFIQEMDKRAC